MQKIREGNDQQNCRIGQAPSVRSSNDDDTSDRNVGQRAHLASEELGWRSAAEGSLKRLTI